MAERRMFSKKIIDTDAFLDMPLSTQALYFHLSMRADDEGFVGNPKRIRDMIGASEDDMKLLIVKRFILTFESGVIVIKHWRIHNYISPDRFTPTTYVEEKSTLAFDDKKSYTKVVEHDVLQDVSHSVLHNVDNLSPQVRLGKSRLDKGKEGEKESAESGTSPSNHQRFEKPSLGEIAAYCTERGNNIDPQQFFAFYESKGWRVGNQPMKDWRACIRTWETRERGNRQGDAPRPVSSKYSNREDE